MNITHAIKPGKCAAKRCVTPPTASLPGELFGRSVPVEFCERHIEEARTVSNGAPEVIDTKRHALAIDEAAVREETSTAHANLEACRSLEIATQDDLDLASDVLASVKQKINQLDEARKQITGPMNLAIRRANDLFRPPLDYYRECETTLKGKIAALHQRQAEHNRLALEAAASAAREGDCAGTHSAISQVVHIGNTRGVSTRDVWDFEVTEPLALPREFLCVDERALREHAAEAEGEPTPVPGVRFFVRTIVSARAAT